MSRSRCNFAAVLSIATVLGRLLDWPGEVNDGREW
jgi:hypothetical protein